MNYLLYISTSTHLQSEAELMSILDKSRKKNSAKNLTGVLLYSEGTFIQLLEGDRDELVKTYRTICADPRHKNLIVLTEGEIAARMFPDWAMGFKSLHSNQLKTIEGYFDPKSLDVAGNSKHEGLMMIKTFSEINKDQRNS